MIPWFSIENNNDQFQQHHQTGLNHASMTTKRAFSVRLIFITSISIIAVVDNSSALSNTNTPGVRVLHAHDDVPQQPQKQQKYEQHFKTKIASSEAKCERRNKERQFVSRTLCPRCNRPPILCVCPSLPDTKIVTSTNVLVLQHPNEFKRKSLSTVPLMSLVLENCVVKVGYNFKPKSLDLVQRWIDQGKKPLLMFPGDDAISLDEQNLNEHGDDNNPINCLQPQINLDDQHLLILVDGTWAEAVRILKQSPELVDQCQQVQFTQAYDSIYDVVRKEPEKHCISTLEACAESLTCLESDEEVGRTAKRSLEEAMMYMVDVKRKVYEMRNPEPRFTRPGMKGAQRSERAKEFEKSIFKEC